MKSDRELLGELVKGMRGAYKAGENAMAYARDHLGPSAGKENTTAATLIAYDLQAGTYVARAKNDPSFNRDWCGQIAEILLPLTIPRCSVLEVGSGEATTLAGVVRGLENCQPSGYGFDVSWSRIKVANEWLAMNSVHSKLFVADLFKIPMASNSVDLVYSSHSLEPNGGREQEAIAELVRVARRFVVLIEPAYELANEAARLRMDHHGYVKGLRAAAEACGVDVLQHRLLPVTPNPMNPSGVLVLKKREEATVAGNGLWTCPVTGAPLTEMPDAFWSEEVGLAYPILRGIPLLRPEHAIVASLLGK